MKKYKRQIHESINDFYNVIAEYVGANVPFDTDKYKNELSRYKRRYTCVRYWSIFGEDIIDKYVSGKLTKIKVPKQKGYSCTSSLENLQLMIDEGDLDFTGLISEHNGNGVSIVRILNDAIKLTKDRDELNYMRDVLFRNKHQDEILFLDAIPYLNEDNIIGYFNADQQMISPL